MTDVNDYSHLADEHVEAWLAGQSARKEQEARQADAAEFESLLRPADAPPPLITLARQIGCSGDAVAHAASAQLGPHWHVWNHEIVEAIAKSARMRTKMADALDERVSSAVDAFVRDALGANRMETWTFQHHLARVLLQVAQQGHKILVGRGAYLLLPQALHVCVTASEESRIASLIRERGLPKAEAERLMHEADQERDAFIDLMEHKHSGVFDITLCMDRLRVDAAAGAIAGAARGMFPGRC